MSIKGWVRAWLMLISQRSRAQWSSLNMAIQWRKKSLVCRRGEKALSSTEAVYLASIVHHSVLNLLARTVHVALPVCNGPQRGFRYMPRRQRAGTIWGAALMTIPVIFHISEGG